MQLSPLRFCRGISLIEMLVAAGVLMVIALGMSMGMIALQKNFNSTVDYATNHADEMRISDYIARDLRSATSVTTTGSGGTTSVTMILPNFYDSAGNPRTPTILSDNTVSYQDNSVTPAVTSGTVRYYLSAGTMYRQQNSTVTVLAVNVQDFQLTMLDTMTDSTAAATFNLPASIVGRVAEIKTQISFNPTYSANGATSGVAKSTTFYNTTLMRNTRTSGTGAISLY